MQLGTLEKIDIRDQWANEEYDFTPWLAKEENIQILADELNVEIEVEDTEVFIGSYKADILAKDSDNRKIIIENQLSKSDHKHLGQTITYASGINAKIVIWICKEVTDEHRQAIDWLNEVTTEDVAFFCCEIELWKIGESIAAPKFKVIASPNDWSKSVKSAVPNEALSDTKKMHLKFWNTFKEYMTDSKTDLRLRTPRAHHWYSLAVGRSKFNISLTNNTQAGRVGCEIYIRGTSAKNAYSQLLEQKESIEAELEKICDEIFGEDNFIENITWNKRVPKNDKGIGNIHEYILLYAKDASLKPEFKMRKDGLDEIYELVERLRKKRVGLFEATEEIKKLYKKNGYDRGITLYNSFNNEYKLWGKINMSWPNADTFGPDYEVKHPISGNPVKIPERGWRWKKETFEEAAKIKNGQYTEVVELHDGSFMCGKIWFSSKESQQPSSVTFLDDVNSFLLRSILSTKSDGGIEVERLFDGKSYFSYPKSTSLLKVLISSYSDSSTEDVVLDFFSGSATTADAVIQTNAEDNKHRKFIMVQLPEECDKKSEAFKSGYKTIAEISKERIRRAGKKIKEENPQATELDAGFRVLKIDSSNMNEVHYTPDSVAKGDLLNQIDHIKTDRSPEDLLFQIMLDWGVDLSLPIRKESIDGKEVHFVNDDDQAPCDLVACFDKGIDETLIKALAAKKPLRVVFRDDGFGSGNDSDSVKINVEQIFKQLAPATDIKVI